MIGRLIEVNTYKEMLKGAFTCTCVEVDANKLMVPRVSLESQMILTSKKEFLYKNVECLAINVGSWTINPLCALCQRIVL